MNHTNYEANNINFTIFLILYLEKKLHICQKTFETQACAVAFAVAVIVGAVAVVWAVVVEHFGVANAVGAVTALAWKVAATTSGNKRRKNGALVENLMTSNTIEVWNIKSQNKEMAYIVADEFTNETVNSLMQYIRNNFP